MAGIALSDDQFKELLAAIGSRPASPETPELNVLADLVRTLAASQDAHQKAINRTVRHSNADHEHVSVFTFDDDCEDCKAGRRHPETFGDPETGKLGHPKPKMEAVYEWPEGCVVTSEEATIGEIRVLNQLRKSMIEAGGSVRKARKGKLTATINDEHDRLVINANVHLMGDRMQFSQPMSQIVLELILGETFANGSKMAETIAAMQRQIDDLKAKAAPVPA